MHDADTLEKQFETESTLNQQIKEEFQAFSFHADDDDVRLLLSGYVCR